MFIYVYIYIYKCLMAQHGGFITSWRIVLICPSRKTTSHLSCWHYSDVTMGSIAFQITSLTIIYSIVYSAADQRKHQSSASLAFVRGIHRGPENSPHKWPVTRKMFPFDDVIMTTLYCGSLVNIFGTHFDYLLLNILCCWTYFGC